MLRRDPIAIAVSTRGASCAHAYCGGAQENVRSHKNPLDALLAAFRAEEEGAVPEGERLFVTVLPTISTRAVPLPPGLFAGPDETIWRSAASGTATA